jgi:hypothetical protein
MLNTNILLNQIYEQSKTKTQNKKVKTMEVHHHFHVEKKNFKEYFLF